MSAVDIAAGDMAPATVEEPAARVMHDRDLLACMLQELPPRDLAATSAGSSAHSALFHPMMSPLSRQRRFVSSAGVALPRARAAMYSA